MMGRSAIPFQALALFLLAFAPFANIFNNPFIYDDIAYVLKNPHVKNPTDLGEILFSPYPPQMESLALYRPLVTLSYISDRALWGADVRGYHFTNVLMHAIATLLLYFLARSLTPGSPLSFFAAAHKNLAVSLMEAKQYSKALGHLKETLRLDPFQDEAAAIRQVMAELEKKVSGQ